MYMLHSPRKGIIHTELHYLGMASKVYTGYLEFLSEIEPKQETEYLQPSPLPFLKENG
ncbi:hypothetical protein Q8G35_21895 [Peribacillus simplex]|uniref:Uncharacterized protein n=2 Tax=Peribacillus TaxID=2675229 RepID=A0AA90PBT2_9BACI|nr:MULTISPECIES: hypothetical protein [Peribacillus]MDP1420957.1 hypothetical protein [Peribacillus simplex]MDP1452899.1 hypothetical protein [Peribacillus frigoritolerans]